MKSLLLGSFLLLSTLLCAPSRADSPWEFRFQFIGLDHGVSSTRVDTGGDTVSLDSGTGFGVALNWERTMNRWIGLDLGISGAIEDSADVRINLDGGGNGVDASTLLIAPLSIGLNVHPLQPDSSLDLYVGPYAAMVNFGSFDLDITTGAGTSDARVDVGAGVDFAWGAQAGLDVDLGQPGAWSLSLGLRYLETALSDWDVSISSNGAAGRVDLDYEPVIFGIGLAYRRR